MPFVRPGETFSQEIQPKIEFIAAPNYGNPSKIPDEDSEAFQFDESNLFGFKRFPGIDRIQPGSRVNYGLEYNIFGGRDIFGGSDASAMVQAGQSYSFKQHGDLFPQSSGLKDNLSDFIGAVRISPKKYVELLWRTRLDKDTLTFRRNELGANVGVDALKLDTTYIFYDSSKDDSGSTQFEEREEISATLNAQLSRYWRTRFFGVRDLTGDTNRTLGVGVTYEDECLVVGVEYSREDFREADIAPEDRVFFRVAFKTIGEVETGFKHRQGEFR
jgi:LPS-assembly protein